MKDGRWVTIAESQFAHEKQGLEIVKQLLPDASPFRAWANFEFRDNRGRWHEVDLLVLTRETLYLIELKHHRGILRGNDHVWLRDGHRAEDSPLLLTAARRSTSPPCSRTPAGNWAIKHRRAGYPTSRNSCSCTTPSSSATCRRAHESTSTDWTTSR